MTNDTGKQHPEILKEKPDSPKIETKIVGGGARPKGDPESHDKNMQK